MRGESLPGMPADLYDLFPDQLVPSELGDVPEGWEDVKALNQLLDCTKNVRSLANAICRNIHAQMTV